VDQAFQKGLEWIRTHQERFWAITGTTAMLIALGALVIQHRQNENDQAWTQLGAAQGF